MPTIAPSSTTSPGRTLSQRVWSMCHVACVLACLCLVGVGGLRAAETGSWVAPTGFLDPENKWVTEPQAYDASTASYAADQCNRFGDGPWLNLTYPAPITTDRIQLIADFGYNIVDSITVEAFVGAWTPIYTGTVPNDIAAVIEFPALTATAFRFRFHYVANGFYFWLYDFRVFQLSAALAAPQVTTTAASSVTSTTAVLHGLLVDDGGQPCSVSFQYRPASVPEYTSTTWEGGIVSGQGSNLVLSAISGLQTGVEYRYRIQAMNSAGVVSGEELSFTPAPIIPGSVGWISASGVSSSGGWADPVRAIDDDTATYARYYHPLWTPVASPAIEFDLPAVQTDFLRIMAGKNDYIAGASIQVQQTVDGPWLTLSAIGGLQDRTWLYAPMPSLATYLKARVSFTTTTTDVGTGWELYEVQLRIPDGTASTVTFAPGATQSLTTRGRYTLPLSVTSSTLSPVPLLLTVAAQSSLQYGRDYTVVGATGSPLRVIIPPGTENPSIQVDLKIYTVETLESIDIALWSAAPAAVVQPDMARLTIRPFAAPCPIPPWIQLSPVGGIYAGPIQVNVSMNENLEYYYTTDGSEPKNTGAAVTGPITISTNTQLRVLVYSGTVTNGMPESLRIIRTEVYGFEGQAGDPVFSPPAGTYPVAQSVSITSPTADAGIRYTIDGTDPTSSSPLVTGDIAVAASTTIKARAYAMGKIESKIAKAIYVIANLAPIFDKYPRSVGVGLTQTLLTDCSDDLGSLALSYTWSQVSGPGTAAFGSTNGTNDAQSLAVSFPVAGTYRLKVVVTDAGGKSVTGVCMVKTDMDSNVVLFTKGPNVASPEDQAATYTQWAQALDGGLPNQSIPTAAFICTNTNPTLFSVQPAVSPVGTLTYTPTANMFGTATVTMTMVDTGDNNNALDVPQTFLITILPVNDMPSFSKGPDQTFLEDTGTHSLSAWATMISTGPANESSQTRTFLCTNTNAALFSAQPTVSSSGALTFTLAANMSGVATVTVILTDNGGTAYGGVNTSGPQTFTITVSPINNAPSFSKGANQTVLEDAGATSVTDWATAISAGPASEVAQTMVFTCTNSNPSLFSVQPSISPTGTLTYTPAENAHGTATVTVVLTDNGGTTDGGVDTSSPQTFTITVSPVNDVPSFSKGANVTVLEDAGPQSVDAWATAITAGPADELLQAVFFTCTTDNPTLFHAPPAISATGQLTYMTAANATGVATVIVTMQDNGGTLNSGIDTSATQSFTIAVTPVNDAPAFVAVETTISVLNADGAVSRVGWATDITAGPGDEAGQALHFVCSGYDTALFSVPPTVAANGTLSFTPALGSQGTTTVQVQLLDNGGTVDGGVDGSLTQTLTIIIQAVAFAVPDQFYACARGSSQFQRPLTITAESLGPFTATITQAPTHGTVSIVSGITFNYVPTAGFTGVDTFTATASDGVTTSLPGVITMYVGVDAIHSLLARPGTLELFDPTRWSSNVSYRKTYLAQSVPGRVWMTATPAVGTPILAVDGSMRISAIPGAAVSLRVRAVPGAAVSFSCTGIGFFASGLSAISVQADVAGVATAIFRCPQFKTDCPILIGSPSSSGTQRISLEVTP